MSHATMDVVDQQVADLISADKVEEWTRQYWEQGEFLALERLMTPSVITEFMQEVDGVRPKINRNFIPKHKKGGSVSYYLLQESAPAILAFYQHPEWIKMLSHIVGVPLLLCPDHDPHACALYFYTEPGDHIGYHYDTSYYKGARYTLLIGLRDRSSSRLVCRLHTKDPGHTVQELSLATEPGTCILFNGDKLHHAVTPLAEGEERIVLTLQYVTDPAMSFTHRWFSNMKDAVGYFGWSALFRRPTR
ncbi:MAG: 2OG-Fe(II) oxygenase [Nitrospirota bacterium]|nr:2OG-Fe(II) oxygenase [Nitrospirota bacterium]